MLSVSYASKNVCSAGKSSGVLRDGTSGANRCYVLAHCAPPQTLTHLISLVVSLAQLVSSSVALLAELVFTFVRLPSQYFFLMENRVVEDPPSQLNGKLH